VRFEVTAHESPLADVEEEQENVMVEFFSASTNESIAGVDIEAADRLHDQLRILWMKNNNHPTFKS
jgi:membrane protein YdbS with pleckstrin-like domain